QTGGTLDAKTVAIISFALCGFADDGFMAGLVYSFLEGYSFRDSARFAVACAAISRASGSLNNPTLSADNALSLVPMV
ncbi:PfkB family carbohydrate kinase, partial [Escherichia sp. R-CC3]